jgi:hypothetical protein
MIIKFKSNDTWVVFGEVDHVEYRDINYDPRKEAIKSDVIVYDPPNDQAVVGKWIAMDFFTKNMNAATEIMACTPIYLMNDQGRTVETI